MPRSARASHAARASVSGMPRRPAALLLLAAACAVSLATATPAEPQWFTQQQVDHFRVKPDASTWQQRYYAYDDSFKSGGVIFLVFGGEGGKGAGNEPPWPSAS